MGSRPRVVYRLNTSGRRTLPEALAIAADAGVEWDPEDIEFVERHSAAPPLAPNQDALYFDKNYQPAAVFFRWADFVNKTTGKVRVYLARHVFDSDEAIVGVIAHEVYEITGLFEEFRKAGMQMNAERLHSLINEETGTLHCNAWEYADEVVNGLRGAR